MKSKLRNGQSAGKTLKSNPQRLSREGVGYKRLVVEVEDTDLGDDIVSTSRENLEKFIRELVKCSELN